MKASFKRKIRQGCVSKNVNLALVTATIKQNLTLCKIICRIPFTLKLIPLKKSNSANPRDNSYNAMVTSYTP